MRHDNDTGTGISQFQKRFGQRCIAFHIEMGIGFVENYKRWHPIDGASKRNALGLTARKGDFMSSKIGFVAIGKFQNHIVNASEFNRRDNVLIACIFTKSDDVPGNRSRQQFHRLRQIADKFSQLIPVLLIKMGVINAHFTLLVCPASTGLPANGLGRRLIGTV